ncbi:MAG: RNA polymerase sigma-70 factor [Bacteroidota bacterium]
MAVEKQNIALLISNLKKGDERAFKAIYDINVTSLKCFVMGYTKNKAQTDDIIQDTFLKLWNIREQLDTKKSVSHLLHKTAYNIFIDKYRRKQREQTMLDGWMYKRLLEIIKTDEDVKKEKTRLVKQAIEKLPPRCKEVFLLSKFEQLKYQEIAERLEISIKTVEAQMGKAYTFIRNEVNKNSKLFLFVLKLLTHLPKKKSL